MLKSYKLTNDAVADLIDIMTYTLEKWGPIQVENYRDQLEARLLSSAQFPDIGRKHPMLPKHIYYIAEGKHYIFYKKTTTGIEVIRLLHHSTDFIAHLSGKL